MNGIHTLDRKSEADRLKLQMGIDPAIPIDMHRLRAMWRQLQSERQAGMSRARRDFSSIEKIEAPGSTERKLAVNSR